jgi:hypothetical protein
VAVLLDHRGIRLAHDIHHGSFRDAEEEQGCSRCVTRVDYPCLADSCLLQQGLPLVLVAPSPVIRAVWVSSRARVWDTIPFPSSDTVIFGRRAVFCILKVPSARTGYDSRQALSSQVKGAFT